MLTFTKRAVRGILEANGYYLRHREAMPYGIDYMWDIKRLAASRNLEIKTFFDVGANIGQTSERALSEFPSAKVVAFEPDPKAFAELQRLSKRRRFAAHNIALSDSNGTGTLFCNANTRHSLVIAEAAAQSIEVSCLTLDSFCRREAIRGIDVLKTDTEGADLAVLRGAEGMLAGGSISFVYTEFFHFYGGKHGTSLQQVAEFLRPFGFHFIATYTDFVWVKGDDFLAGGDDFFTCSNALFAARFSANRSG
jgi:FkbM family methyltransferase